MKREISASKKLLSQHLRPLLSSFFWCVKIYWNSTDSHGAGRWSAWSSCSKKHEIWSVIANRGGRLHLVYVTNKDNTDVAVYGGMSLGQIWLSCKNSRADVGQGSLLPHQPARVTISVTGVVAILQVSINFRHNSNRNRYKVLPSSSFRKFGSVCPGRSISWRPLVRWGEGAREVPQEVGLEGAQQQPRHFLLLLPQVLSCEVNSTDITYIPDIYIYI